MAMSDRHKDKLRLVIRTSMIAVAVLLLVIAIAIPIGNNAVALGVENRLKDIPLPEQTELVESTSVAGKLVGNGNGMQYFGAILIKSDLTLDQLNTHYATYRKSLFDCRIEQQTTPRIEADGMDGSLSFRTEPETAGYYIVYSWGEAPDWLWDILNMDLRGH